MKGLRKKYIWFEDWIVQDLLRDIGSPIKTKYYELTVALVLEKFCELQWSKKCCIGLEIIDKFEKGIPKFGKADIEELKNIIEKKVDEVTLTDVVIATKVNTKIEEIPKGMAFQIKRFGKDPNKRDTNALINLLNVDYKNCSKTENTALVILMETPSIIDLKKLSESINTQDYPFKKIILISLLDNRLTFTGIWPEKGQLVYNMMTNNFEQ